MRPFDNAAEIRSPRMTLRETFQQIILLAAILLLAFPAVFTRNELISPADILFLMPPWSGYAPEGFEHPRNLLMSDPLFAFRPDYLLVQQCLGAGEWPLWNPLEYGGVPLLANAQSTVLYPPRLLLLFLDVDRAMTAFVLVKLMLCGLTAYVCARSLGMSVPGARFFSFAWMLGGFCFVWANWPITDVACWFPLQFLGVEWILGGRSRKGFLMLTVGSMLALFAGHPETAFVFGLGLGLYFAARLALERRWGQTLTRPVLAATAAWTVTLAACCAQLLPFVEYLANSYTFAARHEEGIYNSLHPGAIISFWIPRFFGTNAEGTFWDTTQVNSNLTLQQYCGLAVWFGLVLLFVDRRGQRYTGTVRARIWALLAPGAFCALLAFDFPTLLWVHELPVFGALHHSYHIFFALFAISLLGSMGLERWFSVRQRARDLLWLTVPVVSVAALAGYLYQFNAGLLRLQRLTGYVQREFAVAALLAGSVLFVLSLACFTTRPRLLWALVTCVLVVDCLFISHGITPVLPRRYVFPETELTRHLSDLGLTARCGVAEGAVYSGTVGNYGIEEWLGYDGLYPERPMTFRKAIGSSLWETVEPACAVTHYLHDPAHEEIFPLAKLKEEGALLLDSTRDGIEVYRNTRALPRARFVGSLEIVASQDALFQRMLDPDFRCATTAITCEPPSCPVPSLSADELGQSQITGKTANRVTIEVESAKGGVLVLADTFYPGWRAHVDGVRTEVFPVYHTFRAIILPEGAHRVVFSYRPLSFVAGIACSTLTLLLMLAWGIAAVRGSRRAVSSPSE